MGEITREDLKTILKFGIHLAKLDSSFHIEEKKVLRRFSESIGLTEEERDDLINGQAGLTVGLNDLSGLKSRELLLKTLCAIASVDGHTSPEEVEFVEKVLGKMESSTFLLPKEEWAGYVDEIFSIISENM